MISPGKESSNPPPLQSLNDSIAYKKMCSEGRGTFILECLEVISIHRRGPVRHAPFSAPGKSSAYVQIWEGLCCREGRHTEMVSFF